MQKASIKNLSPPAGRRHRKINQEKPKLNDQQVTSYLYLLLAFALLYGRILRNPGARKIRRGRDPSPAGADWVDAVIPPNAAEAEFEADDGKIRARRRRSVSLVETPRTSKAKGGVLFSEMAAKAK